MKKTFLVALIILVFFVVPGVIVFIFGTHYSSKATLRIYGGDGLFSTDERKVYFIIKTTYYRKGEILLVGSAYKYLASGAHLFEFDFNLNKVKKITDIPPNNGNDVIQPLYKNKNKLYWGGMSYDFSNNKNVLIFDTENETLNFISWEEYTNLRILEEDLRRAQMGQQSLSSSSTFVINSQPHEVYRFLLGIRDNPENRYVDYNKNGQYFSFEMGGDYKEGGVSEYYYVLKDKDGVFKKIITDFSWLPNYSLLKKYYIF
jgi:hypothetical protein